MTKFVKEQFNYDGMYLTYGQDRKFVARFKYAGGDKAGFLSFLIKNFDVEEYFALREAGQAPAAILEAKGYVQASVKKILKAMGYEPTAAGREAFLNNSRRSANV